MKWYNDFLMWLAHKLNKLSVRLLIRSGALGEMAPVPPSRTPKIDRIFQLLRDEVVKQGTRPEGPDTQKTMELTVDCSDDEALRSVLEMKGGKLGIVIHLAAPVPVVNESLATEMAMMRRMAGVSVPDHPM